MNANALVTYAPQDVWMMAQKIAESRLFGMKTPEEAFSLMMIAQAEGLHPAIAARDFHVIQGKPALKADAMLARFQAAGGKVDWHDYTDTKVSATFSHPAGGSVKIEWTIEMGRKIGLAGKDNWKNYPRAMMRARCISEGIRTVFPGCVVGVYTPEEVQDFDPKETVKRADATVVDKPFREPLKQGSEEWKEQGDGFDRPAPADGAPADREVILHFNGKGKPPAKKRCSECSADELGQVVATARDRFKKAKGEYADKNKAEATADAEAAKEWAAYRASQQSAGDVPPEAEPEQPEAEPSATETQASEPPAAASGLTTAAPPLSYGERLQALMFEAGYDSPLARKRMAEQHKIDDTRLVDAMAGKCVLTEAELTKLEAAGVNVKGLA